MFMHHICAVPADQERALEFQAAKWVLETESGSSDRHGSLVAELSLQFSNAVFNIPSVFSVILETVRRVNHKKLTE